MPLISTNFSGTFLIISIAFSPNLLTIFFDVAGPIPLPTKRRIYCVLRSPHVDKKSREHFEIRTHKRIIDIYEPTQQTTEELSRLDLPAGVDIEVKL